MENNREKNKNLHPAEENANPITANPAADETAAGNTTMVSLADLMKELPETEDTEKIPRRRPDEPAQTQTADDPTPPQESETDELPAAEEKSSGALPDTEPTETRKKEKSAPTRTSLFRKTTAPARKETPDTDRDETENPAAAEAGTIPEKPLSDVDFMAYAPIDAEAEADTDTFAFVPESESEGESEPPRKEKKGRDRSEKDKPKKNRREKDRTAYNKEENAASETVPTVLPNGIAFQNETGLSEENGEEIPAESTIPAQEAATGKQLPADSKRVQSPKREKREPKPPKPEPEPGTPPYLCKMVLTLTVICVAIAALLAVVNGMTKDVIAENAEKKRSAAILAIFPEGDTVLPW